MIKFDIAPLFCTVVQDVNTTAVTAAVFIVVTVIKEMKTGIVGYARWINLTFISPGIAFIVFRLSITVADDG